VPTKYTSRRQDYIFCSSLKLYPSSAPYYSLVHPHTERHKSKTSGTQEIENLKLVLPAIAIFGTVNELTTGCNRKVYV